MLKVAVVGAGPAGIYASDILVKSGIDVQVDLYEKLPAPYGLVRYGVAPDHPRIKQIIDALYAILQKGQIRLIGNVEVGKDITVEQLQEHYGAVIFATGSDRDAPFDIPGSDLKGIYGAANFVYWYDGHPDWTRTWPLEAKQIAVIGMGNVALDVSRVLAKHWEDMMVTEIPENVAAGLKENPVTDVHVFGRRGPAQVKFTPLELRELGKQNDVDVLVDPKDFDFDEGSQAALAASKQQQQVVKTLTAYASQDREKLTATRKIHLHMFESPAEFLGDENGRVRAIRTERTKLNGDGTVSGTGEFTDTPVQAVYRAIGYFSSPLPGVPFDEVRGVIPNAEGRVLTEPESSQGSAQTLPGLYATGWVKRGPVGLIGSTKSDAQQTIAHLVEDLQEGRLTQETDGGEGVLALLDEYQVPYTSWHGWELLNEYEKQLGADFGPLPGERGTRERIKVVSRAAMVDIAHGKTTDLPDLVGPAPATAPTFE